MAESDDYDISNLYEQPEPRPQAQAVPEPPPIQEAWRQPPQQPAQPPQPPMPQPFTQADSLALQRYQQGMSTVREQVNTGDLSDEEGDRLMAIINRGMGPLQQRQQQAKQQGQQQQLQQFLHTRAQAQSIDHHDAVFRARGLQDRIATYTDPLTGQTAHMYESSPNKWEQIDFGDQGPTGEQGPAGAGMPEEPAGPMTGRPSLPPEIEQQYGEQLRAMRERGEDLVPDGKGGFEVVRQGQDAPGDAPVSPGGPAGGQGYPPEPRDSGLPDNPTPAQMSRWFAERNRTPMTLDEYGQSLRDDYAQRTAGGGQGQREPPTLNGAEMRALRQRAERSVPAVRMPPGGIRTPQQAAFVRRQMAERQRHVNELHRHLVDQHQRGRQHQFDRQQQAEEHQRQEGARSQERQRQEQVRGLGRGEKAEEKPISRQQKMTAMRHYESVVNKDPQWEGKSDEERHAEALRRYERHIKQFDSHPSGAGTAGGTGGKSMQEHANDAQARKAEIERRQDQKLADIAEQQRLATQPPLPELNIKGGAIQMPSAPPTEEE